MQIVKDEDQYSTDLMKCIKAVEEIEASDPASGQVYFPGVMRDHSFICCQFSIILLGGLSGRIDQTVHTMSSLHKLRKRRLETYVVTDDNICWVLDEVCCTDVVKIHC